ncbi:lantibiotic dehydratase [Streptomyces uncialis]|uniref:lantibiotic dehydratase n=1 Tax=Streptomyces uncialis TaxID=1048205 RepID=UPI00380CC9F7
MWLRKVWELAEVAAAVEQASPDLAQEVIAVCATGEADVRRIRRTVLSVARYVLRMTGRATPAGLFAGISLASFGRDSETRWGADHRAVARADASWLSSIIKELESCPELLVRLTLMVNTASFERGDRLVVPYPPRAGEEQGSPLAEVSVRRTQAVQMAVWEAEVPIRFDTLADRLSAEFPTAPKQMIDGLIAGLVSQHVLITSLHAPSTCTDALEHVVRELEAAGADHVAGVAHLSGRVRGIRDALARHNDVRAISAGRGIRTSTSEGMTALAPTARRPLAVDVRLDCSLTLPDRVAREAEGAASVLARLSAYPFGTPAWAAYFARFFERYGVGTAVPVLDVVAPDTGLGFPDGYLGSAPEPLEHVSARHRRLLALAQTAVLDGRREIVLDDQTVAELGPEEQDMVRVPPHLELCFRLQAEGMDSLENGDFALSVVSASRAVGTMSGRFLSLLEPADRERAAAVFEQVSAVDPGALTAQLSFPPLDPRNAHVTRAPHMLPAVISVAEHRLPGSDSVPLHDLAVMCDRYRLYMVSLSCGRRLAPTVLHALDLRAHTPPLVRFLAEVARAQDAVVTGFDWGPALHLPFLPRLRYGRTIVSPARWLLERAELPGSDAPWPQWREALSEWRDRRRLPSVAFLAEGDRRLKLDLTEPAHLSLLRAHLDTVDVAALHEAPDASADGWSGGRAHEIVTAMTRSTAPPTALSVIPGRTIGRDHGRLPGASVWLYVKLYGHPERQPEILVHHLPKLFTAWPEPPRWWYTRSSDLKPHLRLRIALSAEARFGTVAERISAWSQELRHRGLLRDMQFATDYPETGRWGGGVAMDAAEEVFTADSQALADQFATAVQPNRQILAAANFVSIAQGFTGGTEPAMAWLTDRMRPAAPRSLDRTFLKEAVRLADPTGDWAALKAEPGGQMVVSAWEPRHRALVHYRAQLTHADRIEPDAVLDSLLHVHHIRAVGLHSEDEQTCRRLARATALAWRARRAQEKR